MFDIIDAVKIFIFERRISMNNNIDISSDLYGYSRGYLAGIKARDNQDAGIEPDHHESAFLSIIASKLDSLNANKFLVSVKNTAVSIKG